MEKIITTLKEKALNNKHLHACAIIKRNKVISYGIPRFDIHAEEDACMRCDNLKKSKVIVIRISKEGYLKDSRPCAFCQQILYESGAKYVYYSNKEGGITKEKIADMKNNYISPARIRYYCNSKLQCQRLRWYKVKNLFEL